MSNIILSKFSDNNYSKTYFSKKKWNKLVRNFIIHRNSSLVDSIALSANLTFDTLKHQNNEKVLEAFKMAYPNMDINDVQNYSDSQLTGLINGIKGKYFELLVAEKLNKGERIGDILLSPGQKAVLADSPIQKGWDIKIVDENGEVNEFLQLKASSSLGYLKNSLEIYPEFRIITMTDNPLKDEMVLHTDIDHDKLIFETRFQVDEMSDTVIDNFFEGFNPLIPVLLISLTAGYQIVINKKAYERVFTDFKPRFSTAFKNAMLGAGLYAVGLKVLSIPAVFAFKAASDAKTEYNDTRSYLETMVNDIQLLKAHYGK